jgi:biopolymer transport protein TolR
MGMGVGGHGPVKAEINITPMIDVLLVLIIIFMVITPYSVGLKTLVPEPASERPQPPRPQDIIVTLQQDGTVLLNMERVELVSLRERLLQIFRARGDDVIFLRADGSLQFGRIADVIDIAKGAGLSHVALMRR